MIIRSIKNPKYKRAGTGTPAPKWKGRDDVERYRSAHTKDANDMSGKKIEAAVEHAGWQDIETAPLNGIQRQKIRDRAIGELRYDVFSCDPGKFGGPYCILVWFGGPNGSASHWTTLPAPPGAAHD